jgi:hypothetical protein
MDDEKPDEGSSRQIDEPGPTEQGDLGKALEVAAWGLFFIWIGIAFLTNLSFEAGLLGVGVITLLAQFVRRLCGLKIEGFWFAVGLLFVIGGVWDVLKIELDLVPVLIIAAGLVMVVSMIRKVRSAK